jgi:hypothetical protein
MNSSETRGHAGSNQIIESHAMPLRQRCLPKQSRQPSAGDLPARRDRDRRWFEEWPAAHPQEGHCRNRQKTTQRFRGWRSLVRCLVNSRSCSISRTQRTFVHWKPRSFTSPTRPRFSHKIRMRCFMLRQHWPTDSTERIKLLLN